ncbi:MAG TPA: molybdopterin-binding protein, partial [Actinomycetota bacterium]|nr:molybdopterin-binding protein [Actinomycetota bacterium]
MAGRSGSSWTIAPSACPDKPAIHGPPRSCRRARPASRHREAIAVRAEIISVGTELLLGQIADSNARWMSERLATIGVDVLHRQTVGDNLERIVESLQLGASR